MEKGLTIFPKKTKPFFQTFFQHGQRGFAPSLGVGKRYTYFKGDLAATATNTTAADNTTYLVTYDGSIGTTAKSLYTLSTADVVSEFFGANKLFNTTQGYDTEFGLMIKDDTGKAIFVMIDVDPQATGDTSVTATDMAITLQIDTIGIGFTADNFVTA